MVGGLAGDGDGGVLTQFGDEVSANLFTRVYQNALQYSVPTTGGGGIAVGENGAAFVQNGYNEGIQALSIADGTPLWSNNSGRIVSSTADAGVVMIESTPGFSSNSVYQLDQTGASASPMYSVGNPNVQYSDPGQIKVYNSTFGSLSEISVPQIASPQG